MKAFYLTTLILFTGLFSNAQLQNADFEGGFGLISLGIREMDAWSAIHVDEVVDSPLNFGGDSRSVKLKTKVNSLLYSFSTSTFVNDTIAGILTQEVDGNFTIPSSVQFDTRYTIMPNDTALFRVEMLDTNGLGYADDELVAVANVLLTGENDTWTLLQVPFEGDLNGTANRIIVMAISSAGSIPTFEGPAPQDGSELDLDNIEFNYATAINTVENAKRVKCFPNPAVDQISIDYGSLEVEAVQVYSLQGVLVKELSVSTGTVKVNVASLPSGMYMYYLLNTENEILATNKFAKN